MISRPELERLAALESEHGILSVYIKIDPTLGYDRGQAVSKFKGASKRFSRTADPRAREIFDREEDRVRKYVDSWTPRGRTLAIFSSTPSNIWEVVNVGVALPTSIFANRTTQTAMLSRLLDEYPRMAVVLLDGERARIYLGEQRQREQDAAISSEIPGSHAQGGWAQARFQRHVEFHQARHLKKVVEELQRISNAKPFDRMVIVGVDEAVDEFRAMLSDPLARRVIGHFGADFKQESDDDIMKRASQLRTSVLRRAEVEIVDRIVDAAGSGGKGVTGLEDTIRAVQDGRVEILAIVEGEPTAGSLCEDCEYLSSKKFQRCPACEGQAEQLADVVGYAAELAFLRGAHINTVFEDASTKLLEHGGIGAVLRY
ncbi:MAG: VLRF1 family aeRF1-type release factor [Dehalococcoidia bacterium]